MDNISIIRVINPDNNLVKTIKGFYHKLQQAEYQYEPLRSIDSAQADRMYQEFVKAGKESPSFEYYLMYLNQEPAGFMEFESEDEIENTYQKYLRINSLFVSPAYRNQGLGTKLLEFAKARAAELGYSHIGLGALVGNTPAINLYKKFGFREYGLELILPAK